MGWVTIREYMNALGVSDSTVRRRIRRREVPFRIERGRYLLYLDEPEFSNSSEGAEGGKVPVPPELNPLSSSASKPPENGDLKSVIDFSSKALNSYLLLSERLEQEKNIRIKEKEDQIEELKAKVRELEQKIEQLLKRSSSDSSTWWG